MAFRASTKPPKKTPKPADEVPSVLADVEEASSQAPTATSLSIEDLVGGPQEKAPSEETPVVETKPTNTPAQQPPTSRPFVPRPQSQGRSFSQFRRPMGGQQHGGGFRRSQGGSGGGYNNNGVDRDNGGNGDRARNNTFTPDIDVPTETVRGVLDTMPEGHGFLRPKYTPSDRDIYISQSQIRRFLLRNGDMVEGQARPPKENERYWGLLKVEKMNERDAETMERRPKFEDLVPIYPNKLLRLETGEKPLSTRIIDLIAPIGFGQRGLVVSPPKAGKTTILKEIAAGVSANYPDVHLMAALIGERPEEVTDISRSVKGEVFASNFDESPSEQTRIAEVALDRAKRLVEMGKDVVILLDSITRLARAYNLVVNPSGRTLSGGFDPAALYPAKRFLGAARCVETPVIEGESAADAQKRNSTGTGGSLTVIGTALVETGSRMDDLIYEEFKGTGNMELHLSRILQERRIFPAIDVGRSGTRHDELLLGEEAMKRVTTLRHMLSLLGDEERTLMLIDRLSKTKSNAEFLESLSQG